MLNSSERWKRNEGKEIGDGREGEEETLNVHDQFCVSEAIKFQIILKMSIAGDGVWFFNFVKFTNDSHYSLSHQGEGHLKDSKK